MLKIFVEMDPKIFQGQPPPNFVAELQEKFRAFLSSPSEILAVLPPGFTIKIIEVKPGDVPTIVQATGLPPSLRRNGLG